MWYLFTCVQATNKKIYFQEAYNNQTWQVLVSYNKGLLRKKSHDCFFTWSIEVTWQMKSDISPHLRHTQQPNLTRCWIISRALHWQSLVALWSRAHMGSGDKFSTLYYFSVKPLMKKHDRVEVFYEWPFDHIVTWGHVTNQYVMSPLSPPMTTKHYKVVAQDKSPQAKMLHDVLIT